MNRSDAPYLAYTRHFFADHQDYAEMVKDRFGVDFESIQLSQGSGTYHMDCFELPAGGMWVGRTRPSQAEYSEFAVPAGFIMISACRKMKPIYCNGVRTDSSSVFVYPAGRKFRAMYPKGWDGLDILVTVELVEQLELLSPTLIGEIALSAPLISSPCGPEVQSFVDHLSSIFEAASGSTRAEQHKKLATDAIDHTINSLRKVLDAEFLNREPFDIGATRRADIVERATDYIAAHVNEDVLAEQVAKELGVSYRLLGYAFKDALNVSPYQFILINKLHAVRRSLKSSNEPINAVADRFGFTTPSRFRRQYARLFGELPSKTRELRNRPWI